MKSITQAKNWDRLALTRYILVLLSLLAILVPQGFGAELETSNQTIQASIPADERTTKPGESKITEIDFLDDTNPLQPVTSESMQAKAEVLIANGQNKSCTQTGNSTQGTQSCLIKMNEGEFAETETVREKTLTESKEQTVALVYRENGALKSETTTRVKTSFYEGSETKQTEHFDTVSIPASQGKPIERDLIIKEYGRDGSLQKTTWAHYREIGARKAGLVHHAVLYYDQGKIVAGFANEYKNGKISEVALNFDLKKHPHLRPDLAGANHWINAIEKRTSPLSF